MTLKAADNPSLRYAGDVTPREAWEALANDPRAVLVDVRTQPEWTFVGLPSLAKLGKEVALISWKLYPEYERNPRFELQLRAAAPALDAPLYFICRTGGRSLDAAVAATEAGWQACYNIESGFEGDANDAGQRGGVNGWKATQLPWEQA